MLSEPLSDGRRLGVAEYGEATGPAVLYMHGWPSSRLEAGFVEPAARGAGVRLVALDRPGCGLSDFQGRRRLLDWPRDVAAWADAAGLGRFAVLGFSGGAPYALACAAALRDRVTAVALVSGMVPPEGLRANPGVSVPAQASLRMARWMPALARTLWQRAVRRWRTQPEALVERMLARLPAADRAVLQRRRDLLVESTQEAMRGGTKGMVAEAALYAQPWGFRLEEVSSSPVYLWHGEADANVPVVLARWQAAALRSSRSAFLPGEGHYSTLTTRGLEALRLLADGRERS